MNTTVLRYSTGEDVQPGDSVLYMGFPGVVDFVADPANPTPETESFIVEFGGGAMVNDSKIGPVFLHPDDLAAADRVVFVARRS